MDAKYVEIYIAGYCINVNMELQRDGCGRGGRGFRGDCGCGGGLVVVVMVLILVVVVMVVVVFLIVTAAAVIV